MCSSSKPKSPPPPPPPPQEAKSPTGVDPKRRTKNMTSSGGFGQPGSTLLTGPGGAGAPTTGGTTLLGQ